MPSPWFVTAPKWSCASLEENVTVSPVMGLPLASVTVAVAIEVDVPLATIEFGESITLTLVAGPAVWVRVAWPETLPSVAVIVGVPATVVLCTVAV